MKLLALAAASLTTAAGVLFAVPLLFAGQPAAQVAACGATGSIDGHMVPPGVETAARTASRVSGVDELVLLAVTYRETHWGQAQAGVTDEQARGWLGDLVADVDRAALAAGGAAALLVGRPAGVALGDWADPIPVGAEHAMGFAQFLPSTWRAVAAAHPRPGGGAWDPYSPP